MSLKSRIKEHSLRWAISAQGYSDLADKLRADSARFVRTGLSWQGYL